MQISEFQLLVVLAQEMNMRKASERLFVSQPALSQRLQTIEKAWNTQIFLRTPRGLLLTPAGETIIQFAKEVLEKEERVRERLHVLDKEVHGTLKLAVASIVGQHWLPNILKQFVDKYPHAKISLITGWSSEIMRTMYEENVHLGIIRGKPDWRGAKRHIISDELYLVDKEIERLEDVMKTDRPFIQFRSDSTYYQEIQDWWHRTFQMTPKRTIIVDQIETCKQMAFNGIGYAILPSITLSNEEGDVLNKIPLLNENGEPLARETWLIGQDAAFELKQVKAFIDVIEEFSRDSKRFM